MVNHIKIGRREFRTKTEVQRHYRSILNDYSLGESLSDTDFNDILDLLTRHPEHEMKIGSGVSHIKVVQNPEYPSRCFWIFRNDGTNTDFSYITCVNGKSKTVNQEFTEACRVSVVDQILEYKNEYFASSGDGFCEETGVPVTWKNSHVDHIIPFAQIVSDFLDFTGIVPSSEMLSESTDSQCSVRFVCEKTESEWKSYHQIFARLRVVSVDFNLTRNRK